MWFSTSYPSIESHRVISYIDTKKMKTYSSLWQSFAFLFSIAFWEITRSDHPVRVALTHCSDALHLYPYLLVVPHIFSLYLSYILIVLLIDTFLLYSSILTVPPPTLIGSNLRISWEMMMRRRTKQIKPKFPLLPCGSAAVMQWLHELKQTKPEQNESEIKSRGNEEQQPKVQMNEQKERNKNRVIESWNHQKARINGAPRTTQPRRNSAPTAPYDEPTNNQRTNENERYGEKSENKMSSETWTAKRKGRRTWMKHASISILVRGFQVCNKINLKNNNPRTENTESPKGKWEALTARRKERLWESFLHSLPWSDNHLDSQKKIMLVDFILYSYSLIVYSWGGRCGKVGMVEDSSIRNKECWLEVQIPADDNQYNENV